MATSVVIKPGTGIFTAIWRRGGGQEVTVTCGYSHLTQPTFDPGLQAAGIYAEWVAAGRPGAGNQMSTIWSFQGIRVLTHDLAGDPFAAEVINPVAGTVSLAAADQPVFAPLVVSKRTALAGRKYRGRMYPPLTLSAESTVDVGGDINITPLTSLRTSYTALYIALASSYFKPVLLHTDPAVAVTPVSSFFVRPVVGIQRRRRSKGA